jgi:hypothetical protein
VKSIYGNTSHALFDQDLPFSIKFYEEPIITPNGLALGAVADFGAQNCQYTTKVDAR